MKFYLKQAFVPFVYIILVSIIAVAVLAIGDDLIWLKAVLGVCNVGLYSAVAFGTSYKEGQMALKVRIANDLERKHIVKTGEDRPLKIHEEYKWWKGFMIGAIACAPMLILLLVHTVLILINPALNGGGVVASMINMAFFVFIMLRSGNATDVKPLEPAKFYFNLIALPIVMLVCGIGYYMGARKIWRQQDAIHQRHREIYGEDF
ncbi:MAG: hypothetical protein IJX16_00870 [Clostridia bacterium]|nr:hypothetical protein [Clostridia bacterium]